jgi:hypothetical protein
VAAAVDWTVLPDNRASMAGAWLVTMPVELTRPPRSPMRPGGGVLARLTVREPAASAAAWHEAVAAAPNLCEVAADGCHALTDATLAVLAA